MKPKFCYRRVAKNGSWARVTFSMLQVSHTMEVDLYQPYADGGFRTMLTTRVPVP